MQKITKIYSHPALSECLPQKTMASSQISPHKQCVSTEKSKSGAFVLSVHWHSFLKDSPSLG